MRFRDNLPPAFADYGPGEEVATAAPSQGLPPWLETLTRREAWSRAQVLEVAGWAAVVSLAVVLRLAALGDHPLGTDEAIPALEAWRLWLGNPPRDLTASSLLTHLLSVLFGLLGASDFVARLPAALAGVALVLAPLLLRGALGRWAALGAGAVLAISPLLVFGSRRVDPAILVAALLALLVGTALHVLVTRERRWTYALPVLAGLLFTTDSVAVPALLAVLAAGAIAAWSGIAAESGGADASSAARRREDQPARHGLPRLSSLSPAVGSALRVLVPSPLVSAGLLLATVVLVGTAGLTHLRGLQAALVDPWVSWLEPYYPMATPIPWLTALLLYDLPLLVGAGVGLAVVVRRNRPFDHFLLWWAALAALPLLAQPPNPVPYLLVWAVPLALLAGVALGELPALDWTWRNLGQSALLATLVVMDAFFVVNTLRLLLSSATAPGGLALAGRSILMSVVILGILVVLHWALREWWQEESPARAGALAAVVFALVFAFATNGRLNYANYGAGGAELLRPEALSPDLYELMDEVWTWSRQDPTAVIAVSDQLRPTLLWHLRNVPNVRFEQRPGEPLLRGLWPAGPDAPPGERRPLSETVTIGPMTSSSEIWNWWLYRKSWLVTTRHDIIVVR